MIFTGSSMSQLPYIFNMKTKLFYTTPQ